MTLWSHHVASHVTFRTCALQNWIEFGCHSKKDWQRWKAYRWCSSETLLSVFFFYTILFTSKFIDHMIAAKCPNDEIPGIFKQGNPFSGERGLKEILFN